MLFERVVSPYLSPVLDLVFPPVCVACARVGQWVCPACWDDALSYPLDPPPLPPHLDALHSLVAHQGAPRTAIHRLKYEKLRAVARPLGARLAASLPWPVASVVPVPLHTARLETRGYNQAGLLARAVAQTLSIPVYESALLRQRDTQPQVGLDAAQRRENVQAAFLPNMAQPLPSPVVLVDDVCTTGATLDAAAAALKQGGVLTVYAATLSQAS